MKISATMEIFVFITQEYFEALNFSLIFVGCAFKI
jgi:hypothetical protein